MIYGWFLSERRRVEQFAIFLNGWRSITKTLVPLWEIITYRYQEGSQFVRGFGGIGGMLRYKVDFQAMAYDDFDDEEFDLDDY